MAIADATKYKNDIMNKIIGTPDVVALINNPLINQDNPDAMEKINIFPSVRIPNTTIKVNNYICYDFNAKSSSYNDLYKNVTINMYVVCHESELDTGVGERHDALSGVLIEAFNWSNVLGLQLELTSDTETIWEKIYHVRCLQFKNVTFNSLENGVKINGHR